MRGVYRWSCSSTLHKPQVNLMFTEMIVTNKDVLVPETWNCCGQMSVPCAADDVSQNIAFWGQLGADKSTSISSSTCQQKRRRASSGDLYPSATHPKALKSTAETMELANFTNAAMDACHVRCGVGDLVPIKSAVRTVFRDTLATYCGILPVEVLRYIFARAIETIDELMFGLAKTRGNTPPPQHPLHSFLSPKKHC
jgi:hypothetical protein